MKIIFIILFFISILIIVFLGYHDFFITPKITEKEMGPYTIATKRFIGSYYKVGPTMTEVDKLLRELNVYSTRGVGLYYDDPAGKKESELRSDVGNILDGNIDEITMEKIKGKLDVKEIKKQKAVVVEYPIKSPLSYMLAPMKVYPIISKYWQEKGYPTSTENNFSMEIYDVPGKISYYIMFIPE